MSPARKPRNGLDSRLSDPSSSTKRRQRKAATYHEWGTHASVQPYMWGRSRRVVKRSTAREPFWIKMAHCMFVGSKSGRDEEKIPETWFMTKGLDVAVGITSWWLLKLSTWRCCQKVCKCRQECAARLGKVRGTSGKGLGQAHFRRYAIIMWGLVSWGSWLWDIKAPS